MDRPVGIGEGAERITEERCAGERGRAFECELAVGVREQLEDSLRSVQHFEVRMAVSVAVGGEQSGRRTGHLERSFCPGQVRVPALRLVG